MFDVFLDVLFHLMLALYSGVAFLAITATVFPVSLPDFLDTISLGHGASSSTSL
jgi:hypothetical protein